VEVNDLKTVLHEFSSEEAIKHIHLSNDIEEGKDLTEKEPSCIPVMMSSRRDQIFYEDFPLGSLFFVGTNTDIQVHHESLNPSSLPTFPQPARNVKEACLEEEDEANPLIVSVILEGLCVDGGINSGSNDLRSDRLVPSSSDRVRRVDPTVSVDHILRN
jgi:hypothetical protein